MIDLKPTGASARISLTVVKGSSDDLISALVKEGFPKEQAVEFAEITATEQPENINKPFGEKAAAWLAEKLKIGAMEAWGVGKPAGTEVAKEALLQCYGLKP